MFLRSEALMTAYRMRMRHQRYHKLNVLVRVYSWLAFAEVAIKILAVQFPIYTRGENQFRLARDNGTTSTPEMAAEE